MPTGVYARKPLAERLWSKVDRRGPDECWPWKGAHDEKGYGEIWAEGRLRPAHVVAYELATGKKVAAGLDGCHTCDNPPCCNPEHVFPGTRAENMADCRAKGRASEPPHPAGDAHPRAVLTADLVRFIRDHYTPGDPVYGQTALARRFGVSGAAISNAVAGRSWKEVA